jgi:HEAT repeat protein
MRLSFRSALKALSPIEAAGLDAAHVQALVTARRRHRHWAAMQLHEVLAQLQRKGRLGVLRNLDVRERVAAQLLTDRRALVRCVAARILGHTGDRRWVPRLIPLIDQDRDPFVRMRAVEALGNLGAAEALPLLARVAGESSHPGCCHAVRALGQLLPQSSGTLLSIALEHDEPAARRLAAETIARRAGAAFWADFVDAAAGSASAEVRATIVEGLGRSSAARAAAPIVRMLSSDPAPDVRIAAAQALAILGDAQAIGALRETALHDPFAMLNAGGMCPDNCAYPVREAAAEALLALGDDALPLPDPGAGTLRRRVDAQTAGGRHGHHGGRQS